MKIVETASLYLLGLYKNKRVKPSKKSLPLKELESEATSFNPFSSAAKDGQGYENVVRTRSVIFSKSSCCLSYAVQVLFQDLGVTPKIHEIDKDPECREIEKALMRLGCSKPYPAVFIGGKLVGSTNEVMSMHLSSSLVPLVKPYLC